MWGCRRKFCSKVGKKRRVWMKRNDGRWVVVVLVEGGRGGGGQSKQATGGGGGRGREEGPLQEVTEFLDLRSFCPTAHSKATL